VRWLEDFFFLLCIEKKGQACAKNQENTAAYGKSAIDFMWSAQGLALQ
jgi:hypothetical protein